LKLAPIDERSANPLRHVGTRYLHNDIDLRPDSPEEFQRCLDNGYDVTDPDVLEQWRAQEPINAHSHLLSMLLGSSESIPVVNGTMTIGQWQSVLLVDLDGPRTRTVGVHLMGYK
jgi:secondary thiamine-phosphate synthase enzyme